ncbi:MAG TPA: hypothetical protein VG713_00155 [Pirellulales bacterium]|nr:hypothetical protein [Pirellulales bacterium]
MPSPKTEHLEGGAFRDIPIFVELRPFLEDARAQADPGRKYVISRYRDSNSNLRTQFVRIIKRAGLKPWPKVFQNLRSTRETELVRLLSLPAACKYIGNTEAVAMKHYLQVTDDDFQKALSVSARALQNPVQQVHATRCKAVQSVNAAQQKTPVFPGLSMSCDTMQVDLVPPPGLEPGTL